MEFPNEILEEIFMRLPIKELMAFTIVSKNWNDLISEHSFRKRYQYRNKVIMVFGKVTKAKSEVRIVVAGDSGTGKSSLVRTALTDTSLKNISAILPPKIMPDNFSECISVTVIDASSSSKDRCKLAEDIEKADAVVLTYACDQAITLEHLGTFWLPELRRLDIKVPVIVVSCKMDLMNNQQAQAPTLEQLLTSLTEQFPEIEYCIECSSYSNINVPEVFYYAHKTVRYPTSPLLDKEEETLNPRCVGALKRIFILCDHDRDGAHSDTELQDFQLKCFNSRLEPSELVCVKNLVKEKLPEGVNDQGLTLVGFLSIHALLIKENRLEATWTVLRKFGYNENIRLNEDHLPPPIKRAADQSVELTSAALEFLRGLFLLFDTDGDGALGPAELTDLFSTAPECPWIGSPYVDATEGTASGGLTLDGFLSEWALMTLLDPIRSVENLIYVGYAGSPSSAIRVTQRRRLDRKTQQSERIVFQCFVFGPKCAGKSALLTSFLGRPYTDDYNPTEVERYAVNAVDQLGGNKKTLVLREIREDGVQRLLSTKDSLASCDIAVFVHDSSDDESWKRSADLLMKVASHGESSGHEAPCLIVATKDDLVESLSTEISNDSTKMSRDMGIKAPIPLSTKLGDLNNIFHKIVNSAEHPHLSIPETEYGKTRKQYYKLFNNSLMYVSGGAAVAFVGLAAYRAYAA